MSAELAVVRTVYKETLRSCKRIKSIMRPGHVVLISKALTSFADEQRLPTLQRAISQHGPLMQEDVFRQAFRDSPPPQELNASLDTSFRALRTLSSIESWMQANNNMYDSLDGLSDREATAQPSMSVVVRELLRETAPPRPASPRP